MANALYPTPIYTISVRCGYKSCGDAGDFSGYNLQDGSETTTNSSSLCSTRTCNVQPDIEIYNLQDALYFNGTPLTIVLQCPPGFYCPPGSTPYVFTYPAGTFYFPKPPPGAQCPYSLVYQGCREAVNRSIPCNASQDEINNIVASMLQEIATQETTCKAVGSVWKLAYTFYDNVKPWVCAGSEVKYLITGRTYAAFVNPTLWPTTDFSFPNDDQPSWLGASLIPPPAGLGLDSKYFGNTLELSGTVPENYGPFQFTVYAFAEGPLQKNKAGLIDPGAEGIKTYNVEIIGITTGSPLPDAVPEQEYTQYFAASGFGAVPNWGLAYGSLPDWITFNTSQGVIYGTPPLEEDGAVYTFAIFAQQDDRQCVKEFELSVSSSTFDWNSLVWLGDENDFFDGGGISVSGSGDTTTSLIFAQYSTPPTSTAITRIFSDQIFSPDVLINSKVVITGTGIVGQISVQGLFSTTPYPAASGDLAAVGTSILASGVTELPFSISGPTPIYVLIAVLANNAGPVTSGTIQCKIVSVP